jgi:predicted DNA-binding transcriptional regulator AlpA
MTKAVAPRTKPKAPSRRKPYGSSTRFMNRQELANLLGLHVETVKRREKTAGWPRPVRISSKVVIYDRTDIERFLQEAK